MRREAVSHGESGNFVLSEQNIASSSATSPASRRRNPSLPSQSHRSSSVASTAHYEAAMECNLCQKKFHAFRRKHRCKLCGHAICANCGRTHKLLPLSTLVKYSNEPVRICDRCVQEQQHSAFERRRERDIERVRARRQSLFPAASDQISQDADINYDRHRLRQLEEAHLGPRPHHSHLTKTRSLPSLPVNPNPTQKTHLQQMIKQPLHFLNSFKITKMNEKYEECAICLDLLDATTAILTTACNHTFHWHCLKQLHTSVSSNSKYCPSCRSEMKELDWKKACDHPRVRPNHRFCRDCGEAINASVPSALFRAGSYGALVRCPQCQIQMRVLPHMYNMRVACPSSHVFLVQVANSSNRQPTLFHANPLPARAHSGSGNAGYSNYVSDV